MNVWAQVARSLADRAGGSSGSSAPVRRFKVRSSDPLVLESLHGDLVLEEGDDDLEIEHSLKADRPDVDDVVVVDQDAHGFYIARGRIT